MGVRRSCERIYFCPNAASSTKYNPALPPPIGDLKKLMFESNESHRCHKELLSKCILLENEFEFSK